MTRRELIHSAATLAATTAAATSQSTAHAANDRIQVGFIGCGARSHEIMTGMLVQPGVTITAVCDAYKGRMARAVDRVGAQAKAIDDYRQIIADKSIDAVVIATPDHLHRPMILEAFAAGKDVYCEKPMTFRASEGPEIIAAAKKHGRMIEIGSQLVSTKLQAKAKEIIKSGKLGEITMVRAAYNRNTASGAWIYPIPPDASPKTVNWEAFLGNAPKRPFSLERFFRWRCFRDYSGGIATDLFVHLCTTIHFLLDAKVPARVTAMGNLYRWKENREVPDTLNAILEYPEGFTVNLSSTFNNESGSPGMFAFLGTKGSLELGFESIKFATQSTIEDNRWIVDSWPKPLEEAYFKDPKVRASEAPLARRAKPLEQVFPYPSDGKDWTVAHLANFLNSMRTRKPAWEEANAGHHAAACAHMVNQAAAEKRMIEWDFNRDDIRS